MLRGLSAVWLALLLTACAQHRLQAKFDPAEYAAYDKPGTATLSGQAFLKTRGGTVKYGAGDWVMLIPATNYTKEIFEECVLKDQTLVGDLDERAVKYHRRVRGDGEGRFKFEDLPAGAYYVLCEIYWDYDAGSYTSRTGSTAYAEVSLKNGQRLENVIVTR